MKLSRSTTESARRAANEGKNIRDVWSRNPISYREVEKHMIWNTVALALYEVRIKLQQMGYKT